MLMSFVDIEFTEEYVYCVYVCFYFFVLIQIALFHHPNFERDIEFKSNERY